MTKMVRSGPSTRTPKRSQTRMLMEERAIVAPTGTCLRAGPCLAPAGAAGGAGRGVGRPSGMRHLVFAKDRLDAFPVAPVDPDRCDAREHRLDRGAVIKDRSEMPFRE